MNCCKCGKEMDSDAGWRELLCRECKGDAELTPEEAVRAMLDGEVLTRHENSVWKKGLEAKWDGADFVARCNDNRDWSFMSSFDNLIRKKQKTKPMDSWECLAWVNSPDSHGWLVSIKHITDDDWGDWDLPQRFKYDGREHYPEACSVSYRRARMLPDKSGIDKSTIQGFLEEVV